MQIKLSPDDIETIISEADTAARRLRRRLGLPACDREDLGQDLLIDLLRRLPAFDPARGSLGAFAGLVLRNQSSRIAIRIMRERRAGCCRSMSHPVRTTSVRSPRPSVRTRACRLGTARRPHRMPPLSSIRPCKPRFHDCRSRIVASAQHWHIVRFRRSPPKVSAAGPRFTAALPISATSSQPMASVPAGTMSRRPE